MKCEKWKNEEGGCDSSILFLLPVFHFTVILISDLYINSSKKRLTNTDIDTLTSKHIQRLHPIKHKDLYLPCH